MSVRKVLSPLIANLFWLQAEGQFVSTLPNCMAYYETYFCNDNNVSSDPAKELYEGYGWCCPSALSDLSPNCDSKIEGINCTVGNVSEQLEPLYKTYWVGMTPEICGSSETSFTAEETKKEHIAEKFVIKERVATDYEACHWTISVDTDKYWDNTGAYIELQLYDLVNAEAYIYDGTSRHNVTTTFIEGN